MENNLTVSLETAKKLKEAGWEKDTMFYWVCGTVQYGDENHLKINDDGVWSVWDKTKPDENDFNVDWYKIREGSDNENLTDDEVYDLAVERQKELVGMTLLNPTLQEILEELKIKCKDDQNMRSGIIHIFIKYFAGEIDNVTEAVASLYLKLKSQNLI